MNKLATKNRLAGACASLVEIANIEGRRRCLAFCAAHCPPPLNWTSSPLLCEPARDIGGVGAKVQNPLTRSRSNSRNFDVRAERCDADGAPPDRPIRSPRDLPARLGNRPLRLSLHLLHVRAHDLLAEEGLTDARGIGSGVLGVRGERR